MFVSVVTFNSGFPPLTCLTAVSPDVVMVTFSGLPLVAVSESVCTGCKTSHKCGITNDRVRTWGRSFKYIL